MSSNSLNKTYLIRPFGDSITFGVGFAICGAFQEHYVSQYMCWPPGNMGGGYRGCMTLLSLQGSGLLFRTEGYRCDGGYTTQWQVNTQNHDGYPGWTNVQLASIAALGSCADMTLVHSGTNDILQKSTAEEALCALKTVIQNLLATNVKTHLFLAQIIPMSGKSEKFNDTVKKYNELIPAYLATLSEDLRQRISLVNMYAAIDDPANDLSSDGVHPNVYGYLKMAKLWVNKIKAYAGIESTSTEVEASFTEVKKMIDQEPAEKFEKTEKLLD